jgi:predicted ester cyclase
MSQDTEAIKAIARRSLEESFANGDAEAFRAALHPDCVNHEAPEGADRGVDGMVRTMLWLKGAFSDRRYEIHQVIGEGDTVAVFCTFHGRHTGEFMGLAPTNRPFAFRQVHIVRFQDGKGIEHWAVRDDLALLRQLGALPDQPARPVPAGA